MFNKFAENFNDLLRIKGISQKEIAKQLLVRPSAVNQWIKGKREPDFETLLNICVILDTNPTEMLGFESCKNLIEIQNVFIKAHTELLTMPKHEQKEYIQAVLDSLKK